MDTSKAALPAKYGYASAEDRKHPLFRIYDRYRNDMSKLMVDSSDFKDWLFQYNKKIEDEIATNHPSYPNFLKWMRENQGGARKSPVGEFPQNFYYWINGGRW